jgi:hypothetical protein
VLIEELSVVLAFYFEEGLLETGDLIVPLSDDFEVALLLDEDVIGVVDDLPQLGVLVLEFLDGVVALVYFEVEIGSGLGSGTVLEDGLPVVLYLVLQLVDTLLVVIRRLLKLLLQLTDLNTVMFQTLRRLATP